ncbi:hypothetical protein [Flavobacterium crassostreae]|uniref:Lipoprotein n=1 Tax=Flavobacterium crassostreae TaxID=1763534 RepID=A0A1B9E7S2_9FLAO|nr:hypothetical protein [Flavobacterium crassostreae]OCB78007.1 hypothetical protein LPBF_03395 [Flavobacterium crassostreae]
MKKIIYLLISLIFFSCSNDDCQDKVNEINKYYDGQVQYAKDSPGVDGIDYRQIDLLEKERKKRVSEACN